MSEELIGFVGLGAMGGPIATNLAKGGVPITVYDAAGTQARAPAEANLAASVAALAAKVDTILLVFATRVLANLDYDIVELSAAEDWNLSFKTLYKVF